MVERAEIATSAAMVMEQCDLLGTVSEEEGRLTRRFATAALARAHDMVAGWMDASGLLTRHDAVGNLFGRWPGPAGSPTVLLGSHLDTVRDAGRYDGPLGVLVALAALRYLRARGHTLPFTVEVVSFADEEGLRYRTAYLGSSALAGTFDPAWLESVDADGVSMADALRAMQRDPMAVVRAGWTDGPLLGYCEVHIEQGPRLEQHTLPVGVVSAIAGQSRIAVDLDGLAGHAGTVPMAVRRDALCAAAEIILIAERTARATAGLVCTVGHITVEPGASNVIPGRASLSLDVRHQDDTRRDAALALMRAEAERCCAARQMQVHWRVVHTLPAVPCSPALSRVLRSAVADAGYPVLDLTSGAGHDGVALSTIVPIAMLFVRCAGGVSHHPAESVTESDVAVAIEVTVRFLVRMAQDAREDPA